MIAQFLQETRLLRPMPLRISSLGRFNSVCESLLAGAATPVFTSQAWPTNNLAVYAPIRVPGRFTVARFVIANGSNATGNVDIGLYDDSGNRLLSTGSTARAGTTVLQYIGVTDRSFPPGRYYLALVASSTTGSFMRTAASDQSPASGFLQEALGATTLPATMSPANYTSTSLFFYGFSQSDTL
jgi:hypothetical protein